jgi:uncharacterized membrane protein
MIVDRREIDRTPEQVFAYIDQWERHVEWQEKLQSSRPETEGPLRVGARVVQVRSVPGGPREFTLEVTEHDPPRKVSWQGVDGPVRAGGTATVEALDDGSRSRLTVQLDLRGHGLLGKMVAPLARRDAAKQFPKDQARLKEQLESGT